MEAKHFGSENFQQISRMHSHNLEGPRLFTTQFT